MPADPFARRARDPEIERDLTIAGHRCCYYVRDDLVIVAHTATNEEDEVTWRYHRHESLRAAVVRGVARLAVRRGMRRARRV